VAKTVNGSSLMHKKFLLALVTLALVVSVGVAQVNSIKSDKSSRPAASADVSPFVVGERLNYEVSWSNFIVAGELTLETKDRRSFDGVDGFHVSAQAQSVGIVSAVVYKVNDLYESFIDSLTLQPFKAEKRSRRGKRQEQSSVVIDQKQRVARFSDGTTMEIPPDTYDLAGLLYAIRAMDLTRGKARAFTLLEDNKLYKITVEPEGREKITTRAGTYDAVKISTKMEGRRDSNLYNLRIFLSTDARRLPVLITAEPSWGEVRVELTSATGTKKSDK
jgi:hypothetical protein